VGSKTNWDHFGSKSHPYCDLYISDDLQRTYLNTPLTRFLCPKVDKHYADYERGYQQRAQVRLLEPSVIAYVACEKSNPDVIIGQATLRRFGDDAGYKAQVRSRDTYLLRLLNLAYFYYLKVYNYIWPDLSSDPIALKRFLQAGEVEMKLHWNHRPNRWEALSVVVLEEFQGRGIGKKLMKKVIDMAEAEQVVCGLHASKPGRMLYQSVGFDHLANFDFTLPDDEGGGIMLYTPKSLKSKV